MSQADQGDALGAHEIDALLNSAGATTDPASAGAAPASPNETVAQAPAQPAQGTPHGDIEVLLNQAEAALASVTAEETAPLDAAPFPLKEFGGAPPSDEEASLELIRDVELDVKIELGRSQMALEDVLQLRKGSVVSLDKLAGDPVDIFVNGRLLARGEVLVLNDNFCVRVAELMSGEKIVQSG